MAYTQIKDFDQSTAGNVAGDCLENDRKGFGIDQKYNYAWQAWENTDQHTDAIPAGVAVPCFFSWTGEVDGVTQNWGHVGTQLANGQFWSDGVVYSSIDSFQASHTPRLVGWSTSIDGVAVIAEVAAPAPDPTPAPEAPATPSDPGGTYDVLVSLNGYSDSNDAANHIPPAVAVEPGTYSIYNQKNGMINVTTDPSTPGEWINPTDNVAPVIPPPATPAPDNVVLINPPAGSSSDDGPTDDDSDPGESIPVKVVPTDPNKYQQTYKANLSPVKYISNVNEEVEDFSDKGGNQELVKGMVVDVAGKFAGPDGKEYYRTVASVDNGLWYGIPVESLLRDDDVSDDELDAMLKDGERFAAEIKKEKTLRTAANVESKISKLLHLGKKG